MNTIKIRNNNELLYSERIKIVLRTNIAERFVISLTFNENFRHHSDSQQIKLIKR